MITHFKICLHLFVNKIVDEISYSDLLLIRKKKFNGFTTYLVLRYIKFNSHGHQGKVRTICIHTLGNTFDLLPKSSYFPAGFELCSLSG
jgi:hypothetical protein